MAKKCLNKRSNTIVDNIPKLPSSGDIIYGEIAVNYAKGHETLSIINDDNEIIAFSSDNNIYNKGQVNTLIASTISYVEGNATNKVESAFTSAITFVTDQNYLTEHQSLSGLVASVNYDSNAKKIYFYDKSNNQLSTYVDATDFIKDGMVNDVYISGNSMVIVFNTDAGKENIVLNLTQIFNPSNYYNKTDIDGIIAGYYTSAQTDNLLSTTYTNAVQSATTWVSNQGYITSAATVGSLNLKEDKSNKVTSISSASTNDQYPSAKCVYDILGNIDALLTQILSGTTS